MVCDPAFVSIYIALEGMHTTENILAKSDELVASAAVFKKNATQVNNALWWQKFRVCTLLIIQVLF